MRDLFTQIEFFREALSFTSQSSGFPERLIEKDYVCTLLLEVLTAAHDELVFKGGTCLAKVYADFYRMSEDLDFVIPMPVDASRSKRSAQAKSLKDIIGALPEQFPFVRVVEPLTGFNNSMQYNAVVGYASSLGGREETIKIEVGLREPLRLPPVDAAAKTVLFDLCLANDSFLSSKCAAFPEPRRLPKSFEPPCHGENLLYGTSLTWIMPSGTWT